MSLAPQAGNDLGAASRRLIPFFALALLASLFVWTSPENRTEADDAFWYAWDVETAPWPGLLHPHHMLYLPICRLVWLVVRALGLADRAYPALVVTGAITAAAAIVVSWDILVRRLNFDGSLAALAAGLLAFSYGFWRYSAEVEVYAFALLWSAILVNLALAVRLDRKGFISLALLGALAPLVHILIACLAGIAAPLAIGIRRGWRSAAGYVATAGSIGLAFAAVGYRLAGGASEGLIAFYRGGKSTEAVAGFEGAARHAVAAGQAVVSGNFLLTYGSFRDQIASWFPYRMLADEIYAGEHAAVTIGYLAPATLAALLVATIWFVRSTGWQRLHRARWSAFVLAGTGLALHIGLGTMFSPAGNPEYWLISLFPVWLLVVCLFVPIMGPRRPLAILVAALFVHNLIGGLRVYDRADGDRGWAKGRWLIENTQPEDEILTADSPVFARYLRYRAPATVFDLQGLSDEQLVTVWAEDLDRSGSVFATDDVFRPPAYYRVIRPAEAESLGAFGRSVRPEFVLEQVDEFGGIWRRIERSGETLPKQRNACVR